MRQLKLVAQDLKKDLEVYQLALKDGRTPKVAKVLLWSAVAYALFPFDIIPDFIPIVGHLDDAFVVPVVIQFALRLIPPQVIEESRERLEGLQRRRRGGKTGARRNNSRK